MGVAIVLAKRHGHKEKFDLVLFFPLFLLLFLLLFFLCFILCFLLLLLLLRRIRWLCYL